MKEVWKDIKGYEGLYQISNLGRVKSVERVITCKNGMKHKVKEKIKKQILQNTGYYGVNLSKESKPDLKLIHRLIMEAFVPNPDNHPYVNHIDGDKTNNSLDNLEWCTPSQNNKHAWSTGLRKVTQNIRDNCSKISKLKTGKRLHSHDRKVLCITTGEIFDSPVDAENKYGIRNGYVGKVARGYQKTTKGMKFKYID